MMIYKEDCFYYHAEYTMDGTIRMCGKQKEFNVCPCEDCKHYISNSEVRKILEKFVNLNPEKHYWIPHSDATGFGKCPECGAMWDYKFINNPFFKYCPRCGSGPYEHV